MGWRLGLQAVTGLVSCCFFLGILYRPASLYHPQRRAILHLKNQRKKVKEKKTHIQTPKPPFLDFSPFRSSTVRMFIAVTSTATLGIYAPIFFLVRISERATSDACKLTASLFRDIDGRIRWRKAFNAAHFSRKIPTKECVGMHSASIAPKILPLFTISLPHLSPFYSQSSQGHQRSNDMQDLVLLQTFLGLSVAAGVVASGSAINRTCSISYRKFQISMQYLCQVSSTKNLVSLEDGLDNQILY